jgi:hypothetical protein
MVERRSAECGQASPCATSAAFAAQPVAGGSPNAHASPSVHKLACELGVDLARRRHADRSRRPRRSQRDQKGRLRRDEGARRARRGGAEERTCRSRRILAGAYGPCTHLHRGDPAVRPHAPAARDILAVSKRYASYRYDASTPSTAPGRLPSHVCEQPSHHRNRGRSAAITPPEPAMLEETRRSRCTASPEAPMAGARELLRDVAARGVVRHPHIGTSSSPLARAVSVIWLAISGRSLSRRADGSQLPSKVGDFYEMFFDDAVTASEALPASGPDSVVDVRRGAAQQMPGGSHVSNERAAGALLHRASCLWRLCRNAAPCHGRSWGLTRSKRVVHRHDEPGAPVNFGPDLRKVLGR